MPMRMLTCNISIMLAMFSAGKSKLMPRLAAQIEDEYAIKLAMFGSDQLSNWTSGQNKDDPHQTDAGVFTSGMAILNAILPYRPSLRSKLLDSRFMHGALLRRIIEMSGRKTVAVVLIRSIAALPNGVEALQAVGASDYDISYCFKSELDADVAKFQGDAAAALRRCLACGKSEHELQAKIGFCESCRAAAYCSRKCQQADWPTHKKLCKTLSKFKK